jgi:hypothetical protein
MSGNANHRFYDLWDCWHFAEILEFEVLTEKWFCARLGSPKRRWQRFVRWVRDVEAPLDEVWYGTPCKLGFRFRGKEEVTAWFDTRLPYGTSGRRCSKCGREALRRPGRLRTCEHCGQSSSSSSGDRPSTPGTFSAAPSTPAAEIPKQQRGL